ncbi:MAG: carboxypeptidase-like regulatory domain-containing protein [Prevotella sp.]|nr:carboxypeptidase-like regulatory domain-containing protein [Prevotella sp.]
MRFLVALFIFLGSVVHDCYAQPNSELSKDTSKWYNRTQHLEGVTVKSKRSRYSRKNNPAVELMRKVIEKKAPSNLPLGGGSSTHQKYQKILFGINGVMPSDLEQGVLAKIPNVLNHIEFCLYNNKLILPLTLSEVVSQKYYRADPADEKEVILGERAVGINEMFQSGQLITEALKDFFKSVDIYDDQIKLLQNTFTSPIGKDALGFYRYYIIDTLEVSGDRCIHLRYVPNNVQDFGFAGNIYILDDSSYQVKRCELVVPASGSVNFIDCLMILQEYSDIGNGRWALTVDDMIVELRLFDFMQRAIVIRNTRLTDHTTDNIPNSIFRGSSKQITDVNAKHQSEAFWHNHRPIDLLRSERRLGELVDNMETAAGNSKWMKLLLKAVVEGYVETGSQLTPSKFDFGPITSFLSHNHVDGLRLRIGGQTTAHLNPHLFLNGYYAYGTKSREHYYNAQLTYSLNKKEYLPREFPMRNISFSSTRDVRLPSEKFNKTDNDNVFSLLKWADDEVLHRYNRQQLTVEREEDWGLRTTLTAAVERVSATSQPHNLITSQPPNLITSQSHNLPTSQPQNLTELSLSLRYSPGEKYVSTKKGRRYIHLDAPIYELSHTMGLKGVLGGDYNYNLTEASVYNRFWLNSWGHLDMHLRGGVQWNDVPWWLLNMPAVNLSYVSQPGMFHLVNDMEFLHDRYASLHLSWDMNGKLLNRIPLISRLKWREHLGLNMLWGRTPTSLSSVGVEEYRSGDNGFGANNSSTCQLVNSSTESKPYLEASVGVHNIFRFFHVDYVRRFTHLDHPDASKHGVRLGLNFKF